MKFVRWALREAESRPEQEPIDEVSARPGGQNRSGWANRMEAPCPSSIVTSLFEAAHKNEEETLGGGDEALESAAPVERILA